MAKNIDLRFQPEQPTSMQYAERGYLEKVTAGASHTVWVTRGLSADADAVKVDTRADAELLIRALEQAIIMQWFDKE